MPAPENLRINLGRDIHVDAVTVNRGTPSDYEVVFTVGDKAEFGSRHLRVQYGDTIFVKENFLRVKKLRLLSIWDGYFKTRPGALIGTKKLK